MLQQRSCIIRPGRQTWRICWMVFFKFEIRKINENQWREVGSGFPLHPRSLGMGISNEPLNRITIWLKNAKEIPLPKAFWGYLFGFNPFWNIFVKLDHFCRVRGENYKKIVEVPPPSYDIIYDIVKSRRSAASEMIRSLGWIAHLTGGKKCTNLKASGWKHRQKDITNLQKHHPPKKIL